MQREELIARLESFFRKHRSKPDAVYLFGSRARGDERVGSDVDVGVLFRQEPNNTLNDERMKIEIALEQELGLPVQVVALNRASADLVHRALRDGVLVAEEAPERRVAFEVRRRNEFFDLLPILREYRAGYRHDG